jgi:hypothetical protein
MSLFLWRNGAFQAFSETAEDTDLSCPTRTIELKDNTIIVVLGASGDLAKKKTVKKKILSKFLNVY